MNKRIIPPAPATSTLAPDSKVREIVRQLRNVAVVGMSSDLGSNAALDAARLMGHGFQFFPVHSGCANALGHSCVPHLHDVTGEIDIVLVLPDTETSMIHLAKEAIRKRPEVFWVEDAPVDPDIAEILVDEGIQVVAERNLEKEFMRLAE
jgi:predicted CoA-binding protein